MCNFESHYEATITVSNSVLFAFMAEKEILLIKNHGTPK